MRKTGKISWYGGPHDAQDNNRTSTGIPNSSVAGIATRYGNTKGGWWWLHDPKDPKKGQLVRDIETGPSTSTGREFDLNPRAAAKFGWKATDGAFPTDKEMSGVYLGRDFHKAAITANRLKGSGQGKPRRRMPAPKGGPQDPYAVGNNAAGNGGPLGGLSIAQVAQALAEIYRT